MPTIAAMRYLLVCTALLVPVISATTEVNGAGSTADPAVVISSACAQLMSSAADGSANLEEKLLLCQLYESSTLLAQLGALVSEGLDRLVLSQVSNGELREKRKHEYLRFGKRKHEYLRFGKRKHEYLRFG